MSSGEEEEKFEYRFSFRDYSMHYDDSELVRMNFFRRFIEKFIVHTGNSPLQICGIVLITILQHPMQKELTPPRPSFEKKENLWKICRRGEQVDKPRQ